MRVTRIEPYYDEDGIQIYLGDCRDVLPALPTESDVMVTDPPYGIAFRSGRAGAFGESEIEGDLDVSVRDDVLALWAPRPALVFGRWSVARPTGTKALLTWEKGEHVGMGDLTLPWKPNTEEVYVLGSGFVGRRGGSVLHHHAIAGTVGQAGTGTRFHPTEKPVALMRELIAKCPTLARIVDPFMGSGSTLRAAKDLGRAAVGIEIEERYCEVAVRRLAQGAMAL